MEPGAPLPLGVAVPLDGYGHALALERAEGLAPEALGPREQQVLAGLSGYPLRRAEWLAGRAAAKALLAQALGLDAARAEVLPLESGAPAVWVDGVRRADLVLNLTHTHRYAAAVVAPFPVGVDACDDRDGPRLARIARRVFSEGEAEACGAHRSAQTQAAVWALKEAGLKLRIGGVFDPGARSVRVVSLEPARVADPSVRVALFRLPHAALALAAPA